tara:strand:- start:1096 stop:1293 length:198 start_codon:yes stop_codon:yes gene_type:complete
VTGTTRRGWLEIMNKNSKPRKRFIHLYDPNKEGLGSYDLHYINAYKNNKSLKNELFKKDKERYAA